MYSIPVCRASPRTTHKIEEKAFKKQHCRQKKSEIRNKASRKKRQSPTNKPEHSIKKSHKPAAPSSVKKTHSYQRLSLKIEKIHLEREEEMQQTNDAVEYNNMLLQVVRDFGDVMSKINTKETKTMN